MAEHDPIDARRMSPSIARNREPILAVLQRVLPQRARVLEIASGTGEHAVFFAGAMPELDWQPSDPDPDGRASTAAWIAAETLENVRAPLDLDVRVAWPFEPASFDAVVSINMIHIAPWECALALFAGAGSSLRSGGVLFLYGPFMRDGRHTAPSNESFEAWLKARDPSYGVRDMAEVEGAAAAHGFALRETIAMPANNFSLVFAKAR